jgi:hypothetical protein
MRHAALLALAPALALALAVTGCVHIVAARPLSCLDLPSEPPVAQPTTRSIAVAPFEDARGDEFGRSDDTPLVNLFHQSASIEYPENVGALGGSAHGKRFIGTGSLDVALGALLAHSMRTMKLSPTVVDAPAGADYFVTGRLTQSRFAMSSSPMVGALLGVLGVPFYRCACDLEFEVALYDARTPDAPVFRRRYAFHDHQYGGLYYHLDALDQMFRRGLGETLPAVVRDVAIALAARV